MPTIIKTTVYEYDELSDEAKEKARDWMRQTNSELGFTSEQIKENCEQVLKMFGYPTDDLAFSIGYCQGDGVAFYGDISLEALANRDIGEHYTKELGYSEDTIKLRAAEAIKLCPEDGEDVSFSISRNSFGHHYNHYNTMNVEHDCDDAQDDPRWSAMEELLSRLRDEVKDVSCQLEKEAYGIIEDEDGLVEDIRANEYTFTENGERFG